MADRPLAQKPPIIVISSTVARGAVGSRAAVFALERLGFPVWSVATITLAWHPGHGRSTRIVPDGAAFAALLGDLAASPALGRVGGILTGYLGDAAQAGPIANLVGALKAANPSALYLCDPVMGDNGSLYVPEATAAAIRDRLVPLADVATPNPTELAFLSGRAVGTTGEVVSAARSLRPGRIAITSAGRSDSEIATLLVSRDTAIRAAHPVAARAPNGTGDLFAALLLGRLADGLSDRAALESALGGVHAAVDAAATLGTDELPLAAVGDRLTDPPVLVAAEALAEPAE